MNKRNRARFFKYVQDTPWYGDFIKSAVKEIEIFSHESKILDIGTGPGIFLEFISKTASFQSFGADIDIAMLDEARKRPSLTNIPLVKINPNEKLPFSDFFFDAISFCSILFLLDNPAFILNEAERLLKPVGKIIILTPSGEGSGWSYFPNAIFPFNWSFWFWKFATQNKAKKWEKNNILADFAIQKGYEHTKYYVFNKLAILDILKRD